MEPGGGSAPRLDEDPTPLQESERATHPPDELGDTPARPHTAPELLAQVYDELRRTAGSRMHARETLQATELVHEAWIKVVGRGDPGWDNRAHFFCAAAQAMREILVDRARRRSTLKRGGDRGRSPESALFDISFETDPDAVLALDEALNDLRKRDGTKESIASLRVFTGMTLPEIAEALELTPSAVEEHWRFTRPWLQKRLAP